MNAVSTSRNLESGACVTDISPDLLVPFRIWMSGYKPNRFAVRRKGPIQVRAVSIKLGGEGVIFLTIDTCLVSPLQAKTWAARISRAVSLPPENIFITTTHTHSGPDLSFLFNGVALSYYNKVEKAIVDTASRAWASRRHCTACYFETEQNAGIPRRIKRNQEEPDRSMTVLQLKEGERTIANLINMACHGVVLPKDSMILSADLPGAVALKTEAITGGVSLFLPGAQGDVNPAIDAPDPYEQGGNLEDLEEISNSVAESFSEGSENSEDIKIDYLNTISKEVRIERKNISALLFAGPWWSGGWFPEQNKYLIPFRDVTIGPMQVKTAPVEILTCLGKGIKEKMGRPCMLISYTGGYLGYLMTEKSYELGGYETKVSAGPAEPEDFF